MSLFLIEAVLDTGMVFLDPVRRFLGAQVNTGRDADKKEGVHADH